MPQQITLQNRSQAIPIFSLGIFGQRPRSPFASSASTVLELDPPPPLWRVRLRLPLPRWIPPPSKRLWLPICCVARNTAGPVYYVQHTHDVNLWPPEYAGRRTLGVRICSTPEYQGNTTGP
jgi:hypothetical protein